MMIAVTDLHVISVQIKNNIIALFQPPLPPWILITCRPSSQANSHYHPQFLPICLPSPSAYLSYYSIFVFTKPNN